MKAPMLPPQMMQQAQGLSPMSNVNPANFLIAAADMHQNGELGDAKTGAAALATPQRSMPRGSGVNLPTQRRRSPKQIQVVK